MKVFQWGGASKGGLSDELEWLALERVETQQKA